MEQNAPTNVPTNEPAPQAPQPAPQPAPEPPTFTPGVANDVVLTPQQPTEPQAAPQEPTPQQDPNPQPQPQPQNPQEPAPKAQTYEEYLESIVGKPQDIEVPKASGVADPAELDKFFDEYGAAIRNQVMQEVRQSQAVQNYERQEWDKVFSKYPEVKDNTAIRDTIHSMRLGAFNRGEGMTPLQAADFLVGALHNEYKKGVNDTNVQTEVAQAQPLNGSGAPAPDVGVNYGALQDGGRDAAVTQLEQLIAAGKI